MRNQVASPISEQTDQFLSGIQSRRPNVQQLCEDLRKNFGQMAQQSGAAPQFSGYEPGRPPVSQMYTPQIQLPTNQYDLIMEASRPEHTVKMIAQLQNQIKSLVKTNQQLEQALSQSQLQN